jgi:phosphoribosylformylglycinamidine cyclo-ligase
VAEIEDTKQPAGSSAALRSTYKDAGVDIDAGDRFVDAIKPLVKQTHRPEVMSGIGGFGALFKFPAGRYENPVLVSTTDGVGTKLKIAIAMDKHDTIGIDLVAMNVNDLVVQGAEPLFFLDYLATGSLSSIRPVDVVQGIVTGCKESNCALVGGETAEMPGMYQSGDYDLAGFTVGVVDRDNIIDGNSVRPGHVLIGIASSGLHSNGYSLARKVFLDDKGLKLSQKVDDFGRTLGEELLTPTRIYVRTVLALLKDLPIHAIAHITGGGLGNIPRVMPQSCRAVVEHGSWEWPPVFQLLQKLGRIERAEMYRTFNCGVGLVLSVPAVEADAVLSRLRGLQENAFVMGRIEERKAAGDPQVTVV